MKKTVLGTLCGGLVLGVMMAGYPIAPSAMQVAGPMQVAAAVADLDIDTTLVRVEVAVDLAVDAAGVPQKEAYCRDCQLVKDGDFPKYEITFWWQGNPYYAIMNARTGEILEQGQGQLPA